MRLLHGACGAAIACAAAPTAGLAAAPRASSSAPPGLIAFAVGGPAHADFQVVRASGAGRRSVTARLGLNVEGRQPVWSPGGRRLLFFIDRDGSRPLDAVGLDGGGLTRVTTSGDDGNVPPAWSPDGHRLLVGDFRHGVEEGAGVQEHEQLFVLDTRTRRRRILRRELAWSHAGGVWSPTGERVYAIRWRVTAGGRTETDQLVAYAVRSGAARILLGTRDTAGSGSRLGGVSISPDGRELAVAVRAEGASAGCSVRVLQVASRRARTVLHDAGRCSYGQPQWSPGGRRLAAAEIGQGGGASSVVDVVAPSGAARHAVLPPAAGLEQDAPSWSPDGRRLALWRRARGVDQIVVVRPDGSHAAVVAQAPASVGLGAPVWQP